MKRSKIRRSLPQIAERSRRHSRKLSKRSGSRKVTRRSVRLSKKQRRSLRKVSKRLRNRLSLNDLKNKAMSGLTKMGTSVKSGWDKASSAIKEQKDYYYMSDLEKNTYQQQQNQLKQAELIKTGEQLKLQKAIADVENKYKNIIGKIEKDLEPNERYYRQLKQGFEIGTSQLNSKKALYDKLHKEIEDLTNEMKSHNEQLTKLVPIIESVKEQLEKAKQERQKELEDLRKGQA